MHQMRNSVLLALLAICAAGDAQTLSSGPVTGSVFDTVTHSVRSIVGLPGAAYLGGATASAWDLAMPSPDGKKAAALRGSDFYLIANLDSSDAATRVGTVIDAADRIVWSTDSGTVAVYSSRSGHLQRVRGVDSTPSVDAPIDLTAFGSIAGWSLAPDGKSMAVSTTSGNTGSVYLLADGNAPLKLGSLQNPGALVFSNDGGSLFVYDRGSQQIVELQTASGAVVDSFAAPASSAASKPALSRRLPSKVTSERGSEVGITDLAVSGTSLLAASGRAICVYDLSHQKPDACEALDIAPASISAISPGILVLNYPRTGSSPVWLWDGSSDHAYFVPPARSSGAASTN
jgi:hypothetical protein